MKDKQLNVRIPQELYNRLKKEHPNNISAPLRKYLGDMLFDVVEAEKNLSFCCSCLQLKPFDKLFMSVPYINEKEDTASSFIACDVCLAKISKEEYFGDKEVKEFQAILRLLFAKDNVDMDRETRETNLRLAKYFKQKYRIELGSFVIMDYKNNTMIDDMQESNRLALADGTLTTGLT